MNEPQAATIELTQVSDIRKRIDRLRRNAITSPVDDAILDLIEELVRLINDLAVRGLR